MSVALGFNYKAHNAPAYEFNHSTRDISTSMSTFISIFLPNLYCKCAETAISKLLVKILTLPLDLATPVSYIV